MFDKNSLYNDQMQKNNYDQLHNGLYSALSPPASKQDKILIINNNNNNNNNNSNNNNNNNYNNNNLNKANNSQFPTSGNNLKQMQGDIYTDGMTSKLCKYTESDSRLTTSYNGAINLTEEAQGTSGFIQLNKLNKVRSCSPAEIPFDNNKFNNDIIKRNYEVIQDNYHKYNENAEEKEHGEEEEEEEEDEMNINCNESDGLNFNVTDCLSQKGLYKRTDMCGVEENIETKGDEEDEEEDTSSEFIKELLQNEKKLTQRIYCSEIKALKVTKIFNDLIFSMKSELLAYLTLEDICHFKQALQYYLGKSVTKTIDTQILKLVWTTEQQNNQILWDTLINYSYLREQYPIQYKKQSENVNQEHDRSIRMDLDRTFPERDDFSIETNQNKLKRVLNGLSFSVKEIGYIQGWNQITGLFLLYPEFSEDMVYWIINHLMHKIYLKDLYLSIQNGFSTLPSESASELQNNNTPVIPFQIGFQCHQHHHMEQRNAYAQNKYNFDDKENDYLDFNKREANQLSCSPMEDKQSSSSSDSQLVNSAAPNAIIKLDFLIYALKVFLKVYMNAVYRQIEKSNYVIYIQKWFTVLFSQQLPPDITLCLLASIILQDWNYLIKMALAILDIYKDEILSYNDPDDIMELFYDHFQVTKEQVFNSVQKFEVSNEQMLQIMHLFEEQSDIDNIHLIDGRFYKVEQKQRKEQCSVNSSSSSFFERVGNFFLSSASKQESIQYFEERQEVKYNPIPYGANLDENKFSEIIHFNRINSKSSYKDSPKPLISDGQSGLSEQKHHTRIQQNRPFLEQRSDTSRNVQQKQQLNNLISNNNNNNNNNNILPATNCKMISNFHMHGNQQQLSGLQLNNRSNQQSISQSYKPFLSNNQLKKDKEYDMTLSFQSQ